jgi:glycosyltransferase involved in cell wall biosynthesis
MTFPFAILEAQAMGVPVIAFDIPGPADIIADGKTGFLVADEDNFQKKVEEMVEKKFVFDSDEITKNIENKFGPERVYLDMIKMFTEI